MQKPRERRVGEDRGLPVAPVTVRAVDHIAVTAPSELEDAVLAWYSDALGLPRLPKPEGTRSVGAWFLAGEAQVHVTIEPEPAERAGHFGVVVDDFESTVEHLRSLGSHIEEARAIPGRSRCYTRDPAGNTIEILSYDGGQGA